MNSTLHLRNNKFFEFVTNLKQTSVGQATKTSHAIRFHPIYQERCGTVMFVYDHNLFWFRDLEEQKSYLMHYLKFYLVDGPDWVHPNLDDPKQYPALSIDDWHYEVFKSAQSAVCEEEYLCH